MSNFNYIDTFQSKLLVIVLNIKEKVRVGGKKILIFV